MPIYSSFANTKDEIQNDIFMKYQELLQYFPYNAYLGQTPVKFIQYGTTSQQYKSVQNDTTFLNVEEFIYKWTCPDENITLLGVESIFNLKTNKQYYPIKTTDTTIEFSIQPDEELNFSYAVQDRDKDIDDILISYLYIDKTLHSTLVLDVLSDDLYMGLNLVPHEGQTLKGQILFDQDQFQEIENNKENNVTTLYILSKNNNYLYLYRWYIPCTYSKTFKNNIVNFLNIQKTGQQSTYQDFIKLSEIDITGLTDIIITGNNLDIQDVKLNSIYISNESNLTDIPDETIIQFTQQFLDKLEGVTFQQNLLYVTGYNEYGQLGLGTTVDGWSFVINDTETFKILQTYYTHIIALTDDDFLFGWGRNYYGGLGLGDTVDRLVPTQIGTSTWKQIQAGSHFSLGILQDDTLWAQGWNTYGQLGLGNTININTFTQVGSSSWKNIFTGSEHTLAIKDDDTLWQWGRNNYGQLGLGDTTNRLVPTQIGTSEWKQVQQGYDHTIGILHDNTLWQWGHNDDGQLGLGDTITRLIPTQVGSSTWKQIQQSMAYTLGLLPDNTLWQWGYNDDGQLGLGDTTDRLIPTQIGSSTWKQIQQGYYHQLGILHDGSLWVWGSNYNGELGRGELTPTLLPMKINNYKYKTIAGANCISMAIRY